jgi:hypothetical protein
MRLNTIKLFFNHLSFLYCFVIIMYRISCAHGAALLFCKARIAALSGTKRMLRSMIYVS